MRHVVSADESAESDGDLLHRITRREPEGLSRLYDRYGGVAFALAYRILDDRCAAEDIVQEAFLNVWRRAHTHDAKRGTARTWLLTVVHHQTIDHLRAVRSRGGATTDIDAITPLASGENTEATEAAGMEGERVRTALATLPAVQREVVMLAYFGGLSQSGIAARIAQPLGTVNERMYMALRKLGDALPPASLR